MTGLVATTVTDYLKSLMAAAIRLRHSRAALAYAVAVACSLAAMLSIALYGVRFEAGLLAPYFLAMAAVELVSTISNLGLTQFVQRNVPTSPCRGRSIFPAALGIRLGATVLIGALSTGVLSLMPTQVPIDAALMLLALLLAVLSGFSRLVADFLESVGILIGAQLLRGAGGLFRLFGLVLFGFGGVVPTVHGLMFIELLACAVPGAVAMIYLLVQVWKRYERHLVISWSELVAFGSNDWSYLLQSPGAVRLCASVFLGEKMVTLLSLAQSLLGPVARYLPAVMLRGVWMSKATLAYQAGSDEFAGAMRTASRGNAFFAGIAAPPAVILGAIYLSYSSHISIALASALSLLLVAGGVLLSFRTLLEIALQVRGEGKRVAKASITAALVGLAFGLVGRDYLLCWAAVGLVSTAIWWALARRAQEIPA